MRYWEYQKRASYPENSNDLSTEVTDIILQSLKYNKVDVLVNRCGPYKKLTLEQVFYMPMMISRLRFLVDDLAFRFKPSDTNLSVPNLKNMDQVAFKIVAIFDNLRYKRSKCCHLTGIL